jgi:hypothetical protein
MDKADLQRAAIHVDRHAWRFPVRIAVRIALRW